MNEAERDAIQKLLSASIRVVRTPSPMARAVFGLALQLAAAGFICVEEAQRAADVVSQDGMGEVMG